jgi:hypothetical protein
MNQETAVFAMQRIMRDQRRAKNNPKPEDPSMTLESGESAAMGDHTVIMPRPAAPLKPVLPEPEPQPPGNSGLGPWAIVIGVLAVAVLVLLVWLLFLRG